LGLLLFFIDGIGIGKKSKNNPLYRYGLWKHIISLKGITTLKKIMTKNYVIIPSDAKMSVDGIPQSATGQTTILTGINAPQKIGGHITGLPSDTLSKIILEHSILKKIKEMGFKVTSANAYSQEYFKMVEEKKSRVSATTLAIKAAGVEFKMLEDIYKGSAVFMDITNHILITRYKNHKKITIKKAVSNIINLINKHDFVLYEYFLTDHFGHKGKMKDRKKIIKHLNTFLKQLVKKIDTKKNIIVITSDHGNIEDLSKTHTENMVPTIVFSKNKEILKLFYRKINTIQDIPNTILKYFMSYKRKI